MGNNTFLLANQFYEEVGKRKSLSKRTVQSVWECVVDMIVEKLLLEGEIKLPHICTIKSKIIPSQLTNVPNSEYDKIRLDTKDSYRMEVVPERYQLSFLPNDSLKNKFNNNVATPLEKKRYRESVRKEKIVKKILEEEVRQRKLKEDMIEQLERDRMRRLALREMEMNKPEEHEEDIKRLKQEIADSKKKKPMGRPRKQAPEGEFMIPASTKQVASQTVLDEIREIENPKQYDEFGYELE